MFRIKPEGADLYGWDEFNQTLDDAAFGTTNHEWEVPWFFWKEAYLHAKVMDGEYNPCVNCGGYGYTESISMSWTEDQFKEFACKYCNKDR